MKRRVKKIVKKILCAFLPLKNRIILESNPEMGCNTMPVYQELLNRGVNNKYKIIWRVENVGKYKDYPQKNVFFISYAQPNIFCRILYHVYIGTSKCVIFSNRMLGKVKKKQLVINLTHGMPIKSGLYYVEHDTVDYVVSSCEKLNGLLARELDVPVEKVVALGYPRTDILNKKSRSLEKLGYVGYRKVMVWMPTFRKNSSVGIDEGRQNRFGIPLLNKQNDFDRVNQVLKEKNVLLIVKLHPVQDMTGIEMSNREYIRYLLNQDLEECGTTVYELLAESDGLLTDYSSVYYDYLITKKPIGLVIDDIYDYQGSRGFAVDDYMEYVRGCYIYTLDDLCSFLERFASGIDIEYDDRMYAYEKYCGFRDFKSTERVVDFIMAKLEEK